MIDWFRLDPVTLFHFQSRQWTATSACSHSTTRTRSLWNVQRLSQRMETHGVPKYSTSIRTGPTNTGHTASARVSHLILMLQSTLRLLISCPIICVLFYTSHHHLLFIEPCISYIFHSLFLVLQHSQMLKFPSIWGLRLGIKDRYVIRLKFTVHLYSVYEPCNKSCLPSLWYVRLLRCFYLLNR